MRAIAASSGTRAVVKEANKWGLERGSASCARGGTAALVGQRSRQASEEEEAGQINAAVGTSGSAEISWLSPPDW
jgi:hypothetical protein